LLISSKFTAFFKLICISIDFSIFRHFDWPLNLHSYWLEIKTMFVQKKLYLFATGELKFGHLNYVFFKNHFNHLLEKVA